MPIVDANVERLFQYLPEIDRPSLEERLKDCAAREYAEFLSGHYPTSSMSAFMAYRLSRMVLIVFDGQIPSEDQVAAVFHITIERARSVIKTMQANYAEELADCLCRTIRAILTQAGIVPIDDEVSAVPIRSSAIVGVMNQILGLRHPGSSRIRPRPGLVGEYLVNGESLRELLDHVAEVLDGR